MFSLKPSVVLRLKNLGYCINESSAYFKQKPQNFYLCGACSYTSYSRDEVKTTVPSTKSHVKAYCTWHTPKSEDVFGDLGYNRHETVEMDEGEKEEEEFTENERKIPKWQKLSPGQYSALIKSHITNGDLDSALDVLNTIKKNRDKPTVYMYNLLIRAFSLQGDITQCFKLYNNMKKRDLIPNDPTYNSLLNACANSDKTKLALEQLHNLRQLFYQKRYPLNETHYNTMIKAYGAHGKIYKAFEVVDEMIDKRIPLGEITYSVLLDAAISDKMSGLQYALTIWHMMHAKQKKRDVYHYNLLLQAIRDTKFGILGANSTLIPGNSSTQISVREYETPNLLASPPVLNSLILSSTQKSSNLPAKSNILDATDSATLTSYLNDILEKNRLLLFGGYEKILEQMDNDDVKPDTRTVTLLLEMLPKSVAIEDSFVKCIKKRGIQVDIALYNMLIRKRSLRFEYDAAKAVLNTIERENLYPDIITFGGLAFGCKRRKDGLELIAGMESLGFVPNSVIMGTLITGACRANNFQYVLDLLKYMARNKMKLNNIMVDTLTEFNRRIQQTLSERNSHNYARIRSLKQKHKAYVEVSSDLIEKMQKS